VQLAGGGKRVKTLSVRKPGEEKLGEESSPIIRLIMFSTRANLGERLSKMPSVSALVRVGVGEERERNIIHVPLLIRSNRKERRGRKLF